MAVLEWDKTTERPWSSGLDRGVIYSMSGEVVPWNGLISYKSKTSIKEDAAYYDGYKIHDTTTMGGCEGTVEAFTYPDILDDPKTFAPGSSMTQQGIRPFTFSCRETLSDGSYIIHVYGNMTFVPDSIGYETISDNPSPVPFKFKASAPRVKVPGLPPACHVSFKTGEVYPQFLEWLETTLYGSATESPGIVSFENFLAEVRDWFIIGITNNGDGTWTASSDFPGYINDLGGDEFRIDDADVTIIDADTYEIGDT